ncbi:uncharacterized protein F5Z01DRAFT_524545 [Emericellopsis atlantica]|uniref:Uncharacterized protein n=1 Tax=Emericellopsis atlantica TaxID=2614577 RepID=A0A9P7ZPI7_9HYPO|nr:uncharacterized protein F5Z01DRAFT_524545 [Emericellopsis atlantica]KAG9255919.1 hypothetical protein F5Z01DRAFT_524545 [Emericellopsis atlantica]
MTGRADGSSYVRPPSCHVIPWQGSCESQVWPAGVETSSQTCHLALDQYDKAPTRMSSCETRSSFVPSSIHWTGSAETPAVVAAVVLLLLAGTEDKHPRSETFRASTALDVLYLDLVWPTKVKQDKGAHCFAPRGLSSNDLCSLGLALGPPYPTSRMIHLTALSALTPSWWYFDIGDLFALYFCYATPSHPSHSLLAICMPFNHEHLQVQGSLLPGHHG